VALENRYRLRSLPFGSERHITSNATEELKFDGYRALASRPAAGLNPGRATTKDFGIRYPGILKALAPMPDETVIDGEVVALDSKAGRLSTCCKLRLRPRSRSILLRNLIMLSSGAAFNRSALDNLAAEVV